MTASLLTLTKEKIELPMKRDLMPAALAAMKKMIFVILSLALLMLAAGPTWAANNNTFVDPCSTPSIGIPAGSVDYDTAGTCTVLITITGTTGNLTATISLGIFGQYAVSQDEPPAYDYDDDQLVGILNNSSVTVGAIRLSAPPSPDPIFGFDGDGPCEFEQYAWCPEGYYGSDTGSTNPAGYQGPDNIFLGISSDSTTGHLSFTTPIPPGGSTWSGLEYLPYAVVAIGETQPLTTAVTNVFPFGPFLCTSDGCSQGSGVWTETHTADDAQFTPASPLTGTDYWTVLPIPVCAGPVGENPLFGSFPFGSTPEFNTGEFGLETPNGCPTYGPLSFVTNFGPTSATTFGYLPYPSTNSLAIVPYSDFSSLVPNDPVGIEFERDCIGPDCLNLQWTMQLDYDIDNVSLGTSYLIGGPVIGWAPGVPGPTTPSTDFSVNAITSYTGALTGGDPPPPKGGGPGPGGSVFASLFTPALSGTNGIPAGTTVGFPGFEPPWVNTNAPSCTSNPPVNCLFDLEPVLLSWYYTNTSTGMPINNLQWCLTISSPGVCATPKGVTAPWVQLSAIPVNSKCGTFTGANPLLGIFTNLDLGKKPQPGQYTFLTDAFVLPKGCEVSVVLTFSNDTIAEPAVFLYSGIL